MMEDFPLPKLNPFIKIYPANNRFDGEPQWTLYQVTSNKFYKIGWLEFECLARFHTHDKASDLQKFVKTETGQNVTLEDIKSVVLFLHQNGLLEGPAQDDPATTPQPWWKRAMHGYLYFTIPLFKPQKFLDATYDYIKPLLSRGFLILITLALIIGVMMTLPRVDEFFHTFMQIFTLEGAIITALSFTFIKIIHEFAHAFTAKKYGVPVPHMGLAFIILYPVLYTEATAAWRLTDRRQRITIGLAGIAAELALAAIALIAWNFMDPGLLQMAMFNIVAISLIGSLFINLNPLMRFDGYYVLSDAIDVENLHATSIAYARWLLRRILFGLQDVPPHDYPPSMARFLVFFGFAVLIYRFFLFLGIALIVYYMFFKPLGLIAMIFELGWFIGLPVLSELKIWWERRADILWTSRSKITFFVIFAGFLYCVLPTQHTLNAPAVLHFSEYRSYYAPKPSQIEEVSVKNGQNVEKGDLLMVLSSQELEKDIRLAETRLKNIRQLKRREQTNIELFRERRSLIDQEISAAQQELESLQTKAENLEITAEFSGIVAELEPHIIKGRIVDNETLLFRLLAPKESIITAYIRENDLKRIKIGDKTYFRPSYALTSPVEGVIQSIGKVSTEYIHFPVLTSLHGGEIPVNEEQDAFKPLHALYEVKILINNNELDDKFFIQAGHAFIQGDPQALISKLFNSFSQLIYKEFNLN
jgi:putative peptide zinc metalloprotease protein